MNARTLFDPDGLLSDVELTLSDGPIARPARVGFLGAMLLTWTLPEGKKPTKVQSELARDIAREALQRAESLRT